MRLDRHDHEEHKAYARRIGAPEFFGVRCTKERHGKSCGGSEYCTETGRCLRCGHIPREVKQ